MTIFITGINSFVGKELTKILKFFGEEKDSKLIAKNILRERLLFVSWSRRALIAILEVKKYQI